MRTRGCLLTLPRLFLDQPLEGLGGIVLTGAGSFCVCLASSPRTGTIGPDALPVENVTMSVSYEDLKLQLEQQREKLLRELEKTGAYPESGIGYGTHQADDGTLAFDQAADLAVRRNAERMLYKVERALTRMQEGSYGICRVCKQSIDHARLRAIPYARYCVECAQRHEDA